MKVIARNVLLLPVSFVLFSTVVNGQAEIVEQEMTFSVQATAAAIPQAISYQGFLEDDGSPADGSYDFEVALYSVLAGGSPLATTTVNDRAVVNGAFELSLNFGGSHFWQEARYLELRVRDGASVGAYDVISPRASVLGAPLALSLPNVFSDPGLPFVGVGRSNRLTSAEVFGIQSPATGPSSFGGMYINTAGTDSKPFYGYSNNGVVKAYHFLEGQTGKWQLLNGAVRLTVQSNGNVGIGVTSPEEILHVDGPDADILVGSSSAQHVLIEGESSIGSAIRLYNTANTQTILLHSEEASGQGSTVALYNALGTRTIELDADFGAGTGNPGRVITDELELNGSDLAEHFDVLGFDESVTPKPGMVVSIDVDRPGGLVVSREKYDRTVIGIISGAGDIRPGIYMGQEGTLADGEYPVAVAGRVYVLADASQGPIAPGDMLTTSDTPGHAMAVSDADRAQGAVIGKAMTPLDQGAGLVLVFVSLQ